MFHYTEICIFYESDAHKKNEFFEKKFKGWDRFYTANNIMASGGSWIVFFLHFFYSRNKFMLGSKFIIFKYASNERKLDLFDVIINHKMCFEHSQHSVRYYVISIQV